MQNHIDDQKNIEQGEREEPSVDVGEVPSENRDSDVDSDPESQQAEGVPFDIEYQPIDIAAVNKRNRWRGNEKRIYITIFLCVIYSISNVFVVYPVISIVDTNIHSEHHICEQLYLDRKFMQCEISFERIHTYRDCSYPVDALIDCWIYKNKKILLNNPLNSESETYIIFMALFNIIALGVLIVIFRHLWRAGPNVVRNQTTFDKLLNDRLYLRFKDMIVYVTAAAYAEITAGAQPLTYHYIESNICRVALMRNYFKRIQILEDEPGVVSSILYHPQLSDAHLFTMASDALL